MWKTLQNILIISALSNSSQSEPPYSEITALFTQNYTSSGQGQSAAHSFSMFQAVKDKHRKWGSSPEAGAAFTS